MTLSVWPQERRYLKGAISVPKMKKKNRRRGGRERRCFHLGSSRFCKNRFNDGEKVSDKMRRKDQISAVANWPLGTEPSQPVSQLAFGRHLVRRAPISLCLRLSLPLSLLSRRPLSSSAF